MLLGLTDVQEKTCKQGQGDGAEGQAGQQMNQHDVPLRCGDALAMGLMVHRAVFLRKARVAMVVIDVSDG